MNQVFICDAVRTPIGRYGGSLSGIRADDLGALPIRELISRNTQVDWSQVEDVFYGCANQAGEDNRNIARMSSLLAGLPQSVPAVTLNRLCGSGMDAIGTAARAIACGEMSMAIAGGVEQMSRAPLVMPKPEAAFSRKAEIFDSTMGWRFVNAVFAKGFGVDSMPETAENVAEQFNISREDQDKFALNSQNKTQQAQLAGNFASEVMPVTIKQKRQKDRIFDQDEHPRTSSIEGLAKLATPFKKDGCITAGNASGINDGAAALLIANEKQIKQQGLTPIARVVAMTTTGLEPKIMGMGPLSASQKILQQTRLKLDDIAVIELNEAFAAQALAVMRGLNLQDDDPRVNPNGGAIALGHPLGMSGARLVMTAAYELQRRGGKYALCTMCIGVGQGIAMVIERAD